MVIIMGTLRKKLFIAVIKHLRSKFNMMPFWPLLQSLHTNIVRL
uniref:Uncharacterized protein n=1 Tax=Anguilla anguilla TaxID=7936 RepID=A0A0E9T1V3_ANGAN